MSGHSKWHNIQNKKGKTDAKRAKIFTKLGKELMVAAKAGSNLDTNAKLRDVVAKAKAANMPSDTITRAIKKGAGELENVNYEEIVYEGYGANGVAFVVTALTDNKNRTASNVRTAFDRNSGNLGASGCVAWMFQKKGQIIIERKDGIDEEEVMMAALDAGAEDFEAGEEVFEITTALEDFGVVREALETAGYEFVEANITMIPDTYVSVDAETAAKIEKLVDRLEDDDDVSDVYHNAEFPDDYEG